MFKLFSKLNLLFLKLIKKIDKLKTDNTTNPVRKKIEKRLTEIWNYPTLSMPFKKGERIYFYKNDGLQNQGKIIRSS